MASFRGEEDHMPDFKGVENLYIILAFIVPGLVVVYVRSRFITGRSPSHIENVLSYLTLSLLYYALTLPFIEPALNVKGPWIARAAIWIYLTGTSKNIPLWCDDRRSSSQWGRSFNPWPFIEAA